MSVKVDVERSTKARSEGNVSFKKGRWTEAIGRYTTAIIYNPEDGLGYTNRAAAFLKLDKWKDAERDCSTAIALPKGDSNVKALYRRSLGRKALLDIEGALEDIKAVLAIEPKNETAQEELNELEELQRERSATSQEKVKKSKALPPSPPRTAPTATITEIHESELEAEDKKDIGADPGRAQEPVPEVIKTSFADLKKGRQADRKTFAATTPSPSVPISNRPTSPSSLSLEKASIVPSELPPPNTVSSTPTSTSTPSSTGRTLSSSPIPLLDPSVPGSALSLISSFRTHSPSATWPVICDLAKKPERIGKMLDGVLEPDQLALILGRLRETIDLDVEGVKESVKDFITGLRMTKRWIMTVIMLSSKEKQLGQEIWSLVGGEGDWTRRS